MFTGNSPRRQSSHRSLRDIWPLGLVLILSVGSIYWAWTPTSTILWDTVPPKVETSTWDWLAEQRLVAGVQRRRPSWGGLKAQGAVSSLRYHLRDDKRYLIGSLAGGWTNEVMEIANLVYLSVLSDRIPILGNFLSVPEHFGGQATVVAVSEIFDLAPLSAVLGIPIVETHELKISNEMPARLRKSIYDGETPQTDPNGRDLGLGDELEAVEPLNEVLGCWSFGMAKGEEALWTNNVGLDMSFAPIPSSLFEGPTGFKLDLLRTATFLRLGHDSILPPESLSLLQKYKKPIPSIVAEDHLECFDFPYYLVEQSARYDVLDEWGAGQGVWNRVGKHMKFRDGLVNLAKEFLRSQFGLERGEEVPPYLAVHIRRGDFMDIWKTLTPMHFAHLAHEVLKLAKLNLGLTLTKIIVTTDEHDVQWLQPLLDIGWIIANHTATDTTGKLGFWFPTLLDTVLLSEAHGFVGVKHSTMSILALRRVVDWNGGVGRMIEPGYTIPEGWEWSI